MPETTPGQPEPPARQGLAERLGSFLLGDDIFISYSRADALNYSLALANQLTGRKFLSFVDQYGTSANEKLPPLLRLKVRRSTALVLVGTKGAAASDAVRQEIEEFRLTGRPIIPIDVDGSLARASWLHLLKGLPVSVEAHNDDVAPQVEVRPAAEAAPDFIPETEERRRLGSPAPEVVARIESSFKYTRRNQWLRRMLFGGVVIILLSAGVVGWSANAAVDASLEATLAEARSQMAAAAADEAEKKVTAADLQLIEARRSIDQANDSRFIAEAMAQTAEGKRKEAERLQAEAEGKAGLAEERERVAIANARLQGQIASSRELAGKSISLRGSRPDLSFLLGSSAFDSYPTLEARQNLLTMWQRYPGLSAVRTSHDAAVISLAASADGKYLASAGIDGSQYLWDAVARRPLACLSPSHTDYFNRGGLDLILYVYSMHVAFNPQGDVLAAAGLDRIQLYDVPSGRRRGSMPNSEQPSNLVLTSGGLLVMSESDPWTPTLRFWDIRDPDNPKELDPVPLTGPVVSLAVDPEGNILALGGAGISLFDLTSRKMLPALLDAGQTRVTRLSFSPVPGQRKLASMDREGNLILWDVDKRQRSGCSRTVVPRDDESNFSIESLRKVSLSFNSTGTTIAAAATGGNVDVWKTEELSDCAGEHAPRRVTEFAAGVTELAFAGNEVLVTGSGNGLLSFWETQGSSPSPARTVDVPAVGTNTRITAFSADGQNVAYADPNGDVFIWGGGPDATPEPLPGRHPAVTQDYIYPSVWELAFSPDGKILAAVGATKPTGLGLGFTLWDVQSRRLLSRRIVYEGRLGQGFLRLTFSPSLRKRRLAVTTDLGDVALWDVGDPEHPKEVFARRLHGTSVASFSPDGERLAVGARFHGGAYDDGDIYLWDLRRSPPTFEHLKGAGETLDAITFNASGTMLAAAVNGDKGTYLLKWDLNRPPFRGQSFYLSTLSGVLTSDLSTSEEGTGLLFSPDGSLLAFLGDKVRLWDVETGTFLDGFEMGGAGSWLAFDLSGARLISYGDGRITYRDVSPELLMRDACRLVGRTLSPSERKLYLRDVRERQHCSDAAGPVPCPPPKQLPEGEGGDGPPP